MYLTAKEAADVLRVHQSTIYRLIYGGRIPCLKVGADYRIDADLLQRLMEEGQISWEKPSKSKFSARQLRSGKK